MSRIGSLLKASLEEHSYEDTNIQQLDISSIEQTTLENEFHYINKEINRVIELSNNLKTLKDSIDATIDEGDVSHPLIKLQTDILNRITSMVNGDTVTLPSMESYTELQAHIYSVSIEADKVNESMWSKFVDMLKRWWNAFLNLFSKNEKDLEKTTKVVEGTLMEVKSKLDLDNDKVKHKKEDIVNNVNYISEVDKCYINMVDHYKETLYKIKQVEKKISAGDVILEEDKKLIFKGLSTLGVIERQLKRLDAFMQDGEDGPLPLGEFVKDVTYSKIMDTVKNVKFTPFKKLIPDGDKPASDNFELSKFKHQLDSRYSMAIGKLIKYKETGLKELEKNVLNVVDIVEKDVD